MMTPTTTKMMEVGMINIKELFTKKEVHCEKHGIRNIFTHKDAKATCDECLKDIELQEQKRLKEIEEERAIERKKRQIEQIFSQSMIPPRFQRHTFETFIAITSEQKKNKQAMEDFAKNFLQNLEDGISVILSGKVGNGKTHLACATANYIIANFGKTALFLSVVDAFSKIKATYTKKSEITEINVINQFSMVDLLILDEFGIQIGSEHEKMLLFRIINKRYENLKPTILISNLSPAEIKNFEERIFDRLKENGILLSFSSESNRKSKKI